MYIFIIFFLIFLLDFIVTINIIQLLAAILIRINYLSIPLFIVAAVSVLTILPWAIYNSMPVDLQEELPSASTRVEIFHMLAALYFASSIVNPVVYAIRMQEFRKAIRNLVS